MGVPCSSHAHPPCVLVHLQKEACVSQHRLPACVHSVLLFPMRAAGRGAARCFCRRRRGGKDRSCWHEAGSPLFPSNKPGGCPCRSPVAFSIVDTAPSLQQSWLQAKAGGLPLSVSQGHPTPLPPKPSHASAWPRVGAQGACPWTSTFSSGAPGPGPGPHPEETPRM